MEKMEKEAAQKQSATEPPAAPRRMTRQDVFMGLFIMTLVFAGAFLLWWLIGIGSRLLFHAG